MYRNHFQLKTRPFSVTSDPAFLFLSKKHREAFDSLLYGIDQRVGFIEITGEIGSGKTTLCRALLNRLPREIQTAYLFNSSLSEVQFLQTFLSDLGLETAKKNRYTLFSDLNEHLIKQLALGNNVVLIIDEAQNLTVKLLEQIRMLSNLETDKEKLLQIILVGQPELRDKLNLPNLRQLRQRIAIRYHLQPLSHDELGEYIHHRLKVAGASDCQAIFSREGIEQIFQYTNGVPRVTNLVCDKALLATFAQDQHCVLPEHVEISIQEIEGVFA